jgi:predicted GIY-YIG superfamily endonuclease
MNDFYIYILKCSDSSYYIGHTDNIEKRIAEHSANEYDCYTSDKLPVEVVYVQPFGSRNEALASERQLKKWSRKKKEALIQENWSDLSLLAKKKFN